MSLNRKTSQKRIQSLGNGFPGENTIFLNVKVSLSNTLCCPSRCFLSLSPPKALDIVPSVSFVLLLSALDRSQTIRDNNTPPKKEGIAFKSLDLNEIKFV